MKKEGFKWFLMSRFVLILLVLAVATSALNMVYTYTLFPWLLEALHINVLTHGMDVKIILSGIGKGLLGMMMSGIIQMLPVFLQRPIGGLIQRWSENTLIYQITQHTKGLSSQEMKLYAVVILGTCVVLVLLFCLPYIAAAVIYSKIVTRQLQRLEEEEQARKKEYDRQRNLLLSDMAHDLKTPITTISGYSKALLEDAVGKQKNHEYLTAIYNKSMQMNEMIVLLFEYVKLDSEGFSLKRTQENISELLRENVAVLYSDFETHEMEVILDILEEPVYLELDKVQFQRMINNLLTNAMKHNRQGTKVWILMKRKERQVEIKICDNGGKIPPEIEEHMFEPFVLGNESRTSKNGSGLGLSIAKKVVEMHGGTLTLEQKDNTEYTKAFVIKMEREENNSFAARISS
ncbi:MAG: HAMP domain-containing sensor histidine kinase [Lachnospiraceae bacterium]